MANSGKNSKSDATMDNVTTITSQSTGGSALSTDTNVSGNKESVECLRESKPAPNISINATIYEKSEENSLDTLPPPSKSSKQEAKGPAKIETVFEKLNMVGEQSEESDSAMISKSSELKPSKSKSKKDTAKMSNIDEVVNKKEEGDVGVTSVISIGSTNRKWQPTESSGKLNKQRDLASSIFPVGCMGCKEEPPLERASPRRFLDAKEASQDFTGHIDHTPKKRPSSAKPTNSRNPVTGVGIEDDIRKINNRRKDGNPVTGTGYDSNSNSSKHPEKVPPGGYSKGLW